MSAWSDWQCGAISEQEYKTAYNMDPAEDHGEETTKLDGLLIDSGKYNPSEWLPFPKPYKGGQ